jgi:hypothetical protein
MHTATANCSRQISRRTVPPQRAKGVILMGQAGTREPTGQKKHKRRKSTAQQTEASDSR